MEHALRMLPFGAAPLRSEIVDGLFSLIVGGADERTGQRRFNLAYDGGARIARSADLETVLEALSDSLEFGLAARARTRIFIHAGVVEWKGKAIVLPGETHSGKSTLVEALLDRGARYMSDDYALVDRRGLIHPYLKPLKLRTLDGDRLIDSADLAVSPIRRALPLGALCFFRYRPGGKVRIQHLSPGPAALMALSNCFGSMSDPAPFLGVMERFLSGGVYIKSVRGEAGEAAAAILRRVATW